LTQVACPVFSGFHAGLRSPQPAKDVVGGPYATVGFIDRQRGSNRPLDRGDDSLSQRDKPVKSRLASSCPRCSIDFVHSRKQFLFALSEAREGRYNPWGEILASSKAIN
jgi:hypothetical protein